SGGRTDRRLPGGGRAALYLQRHAVTVAQANTVLRSVNLDGDHVCVDIFRRPDGTFGFDEFRRDPEDGRGWFSIGHHGARAFPTEAGALAAAREAIGWFEG
ncbi:MAG: hypothetical protein AAF390_20820, partial [Pseudomonadota bacterium]